MKSVLANYLFVPRLASSHVQAVSGGEYYLSHV
nr:MAG TPA: hypothetical protein [Caudoviricetes sp.]